MRPIAEQVAVDTIAQAITIQGVAFVAKLLGFTQASWTLVASPLIALAMFGASFIGYGVWFMRKQAKIVADVRAVQGAQADLPRQGTKPSTSRPSFQPRPIV